MVLGVKMAEIFEKKPQLKHEKAPRIGKNEK